MEQTINPPLSGNVFICIFQYLSRLHIPVFVPSA